MVYLQALLILFQPLCQVISVACKTVTAMKHGPRGFGLHTGALMPGHSLKTSSQKKESCPKNKSSAHMMVYICSHCGMA
jgi:hypothetical protein